MPAKSAATVGTCGAYLAECSVTVGEEESTELLLLLRWMKMRCFLLPYLKVSISTARSSRKEREKNPFVKKSQLQQGREEKREEDEAASQPNQLRLACFKFPSHQRDIPASAAVTAVAAATAVRLGGTSRSHSRRRTTRRRGRGEEFFFHIISV